MFYFKPPRGNIQLEQLQDCVMARVSYFVGIDSRIHKTEDKCSKFEFLMSGTPMDRTGHFILRLLTCGSHQLEEFVVNSEARLFTKRIESFTTKDLIQFLKTSIRHIEEILNSTEEYSIWLNTAINILKYIQTCAFVSHYTNCDHDETCSQHVLTVPFLYCLSLVKNREVLLVRGNCKVPCGKWKKLLENMFYCHLNFGLKDVVSQKDLLNELNCDQRLLDLKGKINQMCRRGAVIENNAVDGSVIYANEVEEISSNFPPCMSVLYRNLRTKHRLNHQSRFYFSLYLKDIGMPLKESILFWKREYLKPKTCNNISCTHSWQRDSVRYEYSIRHMYGLEGSCRNYSSPSCSNIHSSILGPTSQGGCPFVHFSEKGLVPFLDPAVIRDEEVFNQIVQLKRSERPEDACFFYSKALARTKCSETKWTFKTLHKSPVQFYNRVKHLVTETKVETVCK